jgi:hypothetical protein
MNALPHTYGCPHCSWTRTFPPSVFNYRIRGQKAIALHFKKCHPGEKPPMKPEMPGLIKTVVTTEKEKAFVDKLGDVITGALAAGVHPGDVVVGIVSAYCGLSVGLGFTLVQAKDVVETWWEEEESDAKA